MERLLTIGLDRPESAELRQRIAGPVLAYPTLPRVKVDRGRLLAERPGAADGFVPVSHVVFHGIFDDDFDTITPLALWGGPCLPDAGA